MYAVMNELNKKGLLHTDCMTVTGKTVGENIAGCTNLNPEVIRPIENPYSETGGIAVLKGNLAPDGSVVKRSAVVPEMLVHEGPARIFESDEAATEAIKTGKINPGDVIVIRYEGPKGGPGMREMLNQPLQLQDTGLDLRWRLLRTDVSVAHPAAHPSGMCHRKLLWADRLRW